MAETRQHLPSLTPLRGIAALVVVLCHLSGPQLWLRNATLFKIAGRGYLAVDLFFVLSGFVLTHVYYSEVAAGVSIRSVPRFLWARFARIYPTYLAVTLTVALISASGGGLSVRQLASNLAMVQIPWTNAQSLVFVAWSVSAEWNAYLLFPFIAPLLLRCGGKIAFAVFGALAFALYAFASIYSDWGSLTFGWGALARAAPQFVMGILLYRAYRSAVLQRVWASDLSFIAVIASLGSIPALGLSDACAIVALPALILAAVSNKGVAAEMLNCRPLFWLGQISYSLYLGQIFVFATASRMSLTPVGALLSPWGAVTLGILLALLVGAVLHRAVEGPSRIALKRWLNCVPAASAPARSDARGA